jgi:hypothetical protein
MKTLKVLLILLMAIPAFAQEETEELPKNPKAQEKIKAAEAAYITERLGLTPEEAEKFWPVFHEFRQKRQGLREQYKDARKAGKPEKEILDLEFKLKQDQLDLEKDYSQRFQKIISPQKLMNLRQAEGDFRRLLLRQIQERQNQAERMQRQRDRSQQRLQQRNN